MEKLTQGHEKFIQGRGEKKNGRSLFGKTIKKAVVAKQHGSK